MPDIRYVCVSDLHFGAENSILTKLTEGELTADVVHPSPVLSGLMACLTELVAANEDASRKPTLILCGDILELALTTDDLALMVFERFLDLAFPPAGAGLFDDTILFVPGNHDHHLWEGARERQYAQYLTTVPAGERINPPWHTTRLLAESDPQPVESELLTTVIRRHPQCQGVTVRAVYPNLGLVTPDGNRAVVFHHGHFVESIYRLMSSMKDLIFPGRPQPQNVWDWEAENFAWIDFFWSTLGRSGDVGADVGLIYDMLQSPKDIQHLADNMASGIAARSGGPAWRRGAERWVLRRGLSTVAGRVAASERRTPAQPLKSSSETGLRQYLEGPVRSQLAGETNGALPPDVTFVFGHTHKPFAGSRQVDGYARPVTVFNTGGWVVDTVVTEPLQGASVILVDENLEVLGLRMYNQAAAKGSYRVSLELDEGPRRDTDFSRRIGAIVQAEAEPWLSLSGSCAALVTERIAALSKILNDPTLWNVPAQR